MNKPDPKDLRVLLDNAAQRLRFGPYSVPKTRVGDDLLCEAHGLQVVASWYGPMQWPNAHKKGRAQLIVCGDLVRALSLETREAIAIHWGVHLMTVANWRKKLGLAGTVTVSNSEFKRAKMRISRIQQPKIWVHPGVRFLKKLTVEERRAVVRQVNLRQGNQPWSAIEIGKLSELDNAIAAKKLRRSLSSVANARQRYKIPPPSIYCRCRFCQYEWQSRKKVLPKYCARCNRKAWRESDN